MRVVAGEARGRPITAPEGNRTRPTSDRVRESIFNMLFSLDANRGARVLDLYAGCGALGIEALSRGAESCVFVEKDRRAIECIRKNLDAVGYSDRASVNVGSAPTQMDKPLRDTASSCVARAPITASSALGRSTAAGDS